MSSKTQSGSKVFSIKLTDKLRAVFPTEPYMYCRKPQTDYPSAISLSASLKLRQQMSQAVDKAAKWG